MIKKRSRQADPGVESSEDSAASDCCEEASAEGAKCPHVTRAVNFQKLKKALKKTNLNGKCLACAKSNLNFVENNSEEEGGRAEPKESPIWICLQCGNQGCGKEERMHAIQHFLKSHSDPHSMMVDNLRWSVWCCECETEVDIVSRKKLQETVEFLKKHSKRTAHNEQSKPQQNQRRKEADKPEEEKEKLPPNLPKVAGLVNLGNTCFFNAALQCLSQTPYLVKVLDDMRMPGEKFVLPGGKHKPPKAENEIELPPIEGTLEKWGSFTASLWKMLTKMRNSTGTGPNDASELLGALKRKTAQCMDGGQHDSHELLRYLLDIVRNEDLRRYQSIILERVGLNEKTNPEGVEDGIKSIVKFYGNQASARLLGPEVVFQGVLVSTLQCLECRNTSQSTEPFLDLSLPVIVEAAETGDKSPVLKPHRRSRNLDRRVRVTFNLTRSCEPYKQAPAGKQGKGKAGKNDGNNGDNGNFQKGQSKDGKESRGILQSENDADVEDNVELVCDVVYGPENAPAVDSVSSAVSPDDETQPDDESPTRSPRDRHRLFSPTESSASLSADVLDICAPNSPSPTDVSMADLTQRKLDRLASLESPENDNGDETRLSLSTSLAVNSDLTSPEGPTASLSSVASKDSPTSPLSALPDRGDAPAKERNEFADLERIKSLEIANGAGEAKCTEALVVGGGEARSPEANDTLVEGPEERSKYPKPKRSPTSSTSGSEYDCDIWDSSKKQFWEPKAKKPPEEKAGAKLEETAGSPKSPIEGSVDGVDVKEEEFWERKSKKASAVGEKVESRSGECSGPVMGPMTREDAERAERRARVEARLENVLVLTKGESLEMPNGGIEEQTCPKARNAEGGKPEGAASSTSGSECSFDVWDWIVGSREKDRSPEAPEAPEVPEVPEVLGASASSDSLESEGSSGGPADYKLLSMICRRITTKAKAAKDGPVDGEDAKKDGVFDWRANKEPPAEGKKARTRTEETVESPTSPTDSLVDALMDGEESKEPEFWHRADKKTSETDVPPVEGKKDRTNVEELPESPEACNGINGDASEESGAATAVETYQPAFDRYHPKEGECSIESCLNQFTTVEVMTGSNKIGCDVCTNREKKSKPDCKMVRTTSTKQYLISRVPAILILHLKRSQAQHVDFRKVNKHVTIPMVLDLSPNCKRPKKPKLYALYGVVEHSGTVHGGHYIAYVKSRVPLSPDDPRWAFLPSKDAKETEESPDTSDSESKAEQAAASPTRTVKPPPGKWYYTSDTRVVEVDEAAVLNSQAYLLFYERIL